MEQLKSRIERSKVLWDIYQEVTRAVKDSIAERKSVNRRF